MNALTPTPSASAEIAALLELCRRTHEAELGVIEQRARRLGQALVRKAAFGGIRRDEFADAIAFAGYVLPDETQDQFEARRQGFAMGLIDGIAAVAAR